MCLRPALLWSALVLSQFCFSQTQRVHSISNRDLTGTITHVEIPFKLYRDYLIVVQGSLGTLEGLNFLVDTGVNPTAVDRRIARTLGLTGGAHTLALLNQNTTVTEVMLPEVQLGPIRAESLPGVVQDLSSFHEALGTRIDAIVGFDVLSLSSFRINYTTKRIVFGPIESALTSVPFDTGPPVVTLRMQVENEPVRLLVDSGAAELVLFECQLHGRLHQLPVSGVVKRFFNGANRESALKEVSLQGMRLGATDFGPQRALTTEKNANCGRSFDGIVGIRRLGLKWVAFDFQHQTFSWER